MDSRKISFVIFVLCVCLYFKLVFGGNKIRLREVEVLTLYQGKMTTGRRSSSVLQLKCAGGSAGCSAFVPEVVQCYNRGWDGFDAQWECKTDMDSKYRFGKIDVNCEGYDYPDDPYILRGSCGLEYTIELTDEGRAKQGSSDYHGWNSYQQYGNRNRYNNSSGFGELVMFVIVAVIFYMVFKTCASNPNIDTDTVPPPYSHDPNNMGRPGASAPPPSYSPDPPGFKREYTQGNTAPPPYQEPGFRNEHTQAGTAGNTPTGSSTNSNYGFWSGAAAGGLLGYLFGGRTRTDYRYNRWGGGYGGGWGSGYSDGWGPSYHHTPQYRNTGGWFGNWFGGNRAYRPSHNSYGFSSFGGSSSSSSSSPSSGSRTTSGMGGTSRR